METDPLLAGVFELYLMIATSLASVNETGHEMKAKRTHEKSEPSHPSLMEIENSSVASNIYPRRNSNESKTASLSKGEGAMRRSVRGGGR